MGMRSAIRTATTGCKPGRRSALVQRYGPKPGPDALGTAAAGRHETCSLHLISEAPQEPTMHKLSLPPNLTERIIPRTGRTHPFDAIDPPKTPSAATDTPNTSPRPRSPTA